MQKLCVALGGNLKIIKANHEILIIRLSHDGKRLLNSQPCSLCVRYLKRIGIRKINYSNEIGEIISVSINNLGDGKLTTYYRCLKSK